MNQPFSNWLVVSDVDGTLSNDIKRVPKRNLEAIRRFTQLGGHFTLASGRNPNSLQKYYNMIETDCPAIVNNGSGIYDYKNKRMIWENTINARGREIAALVHKKFPSVEIAVFSGDFIYMVNARFLMPIQSMTTHCIGKKRCRMEEIPDEGWSKVIFFGMPWVINKLMAFVETLEDKQTNYMRSSKASFEMIHEGCHKGAGILELARILHLDDRHTAAIGNYYNDVDMLKTVHLSAACSQAPKAVRALCDYQACHCNRGAVADFLAYIMYHHDKDKTVVV